MARMTIARIATSAGLGVASCAAIALQSAGSPHYSPRGMQGNRGCRRRMRRPRYMASALVSAGLLRRSVCAAFGDERGDSPDELIGDRLRVREGERILARAVPRDSLLQLGIGRGHGVDSEVLLPG